MILDQIKILTHEMKLYGIHQAAQRRSQEAITSHLDYLEFLRLLLEDEKLLRKDSKAKRLVTQAKFRRSATLEDWDHSLDRGITKVQIKNLASLNFAYDNINLIFLGPTGSGKTQLAIALGRKLCQEGMKTRFYGINLLFEDVLAAKSSGKYVSFIRNLNKAYVLVLDDFGLRNYTHEEANILMDLLEERYQKGSLIITSQVDPNGWLKLFEDSVIAEALVDRLSHPSQMITLKGTSYRKKLNSKNSQKNEKKNKKEN